MPVEVGRRPRSVVDGHHGDPDYSVLRRASTPARIRVRRARVDVDVRGGRGEGVHEYHGLARTCGGRHRGVLATLNGRARGCVKLPARFFPRFARCRAQVRSVVDRFPFASEGTQLGEVPAHLISK